MTSRITALALDALDIDLVADFWAAALGWSTVERDADGIGLAADDRSLPTMDVVRVPERKTTKNRLHLDLRADGTSTDAEVERLLALGARRTDVGQAPDSTWSVLADPEGNEFCVLSRTVQQVDAEA